MENQPMPAPAPEADPPEAPQLLAAPEAPEAGPPVQLEQHLRLNYSKAEIIPADFTKIVCSNEEFHIDLGTGHLGLDSRDVQVHCRVVMSPYSIKRLCETLANLLEQYEQNFGRIETDANKRVISQ